MKKSSDQLNSFTKEFLVFLTTQQAGFKIKNEYIDVHELFRETEEFFRNILDWNNNKLEMDIHEETGIWSDKQLLKAVLHNLVDNANKHTDNGTIMLTAGIDNRQLVITVADTGKVIPAEKLQKLRNAYFLYSFGVPLSTSSFSSPPRL